MSTPNIEELINNLTIKAGVMEMGEKIAWGSDTALMRQAAATLQSQAERIAELERESETHSKAYGLAIVERDNLRTEVEAVRKANLDCVDHYNAALDEINELGQQLKVAQEGWRCECSTDDACRFARERDALRAQLDAIAATEPVLVVEKEPDYWSGGHFHEGSKPHVKPTKVWSLPIGTKLFTRPMPAQDVTELVEALEQLARLGNGEHYGNSDGNMIARDALSKYKGAK